MATWDNTSRNSASFSDENRNSASFSDASRSSYVRVGSLPGSYFSGLSANDTVPGTGGMRLGDLTPNTIINTTLWSNENKN